MFNRFSVLFLTEMRTLHSWVVDNKSGIGVMSICQPKLMSSSLRLLGSRGGEGEVGREVSNQSCCLTHGPKLKRQIMF